MSMNNDVDMKLLELKQIIEYTDNALDQLLEAQDKSSDQHKFDYCLNLKKINAAQFDYFKLAQDTSQRSQGLIGLTYSLSFGYCKSIDYISDALGFLSAKDLDSPITGNSVNSEETYFLALDKLCSHSMKEKKSGLSLLKEAAFADQPDVNAMFILGFIFYKKKMYPEAYALLQKSFCEGCPVAGYYCAEIALKKQDHTVAKHYYEQAASMGVSFALRGMYLHGKNINDLFLAAIQDEPESQFMMSQFCRQISNEEQANIWLNKAAENGHVLAQSIIRNQAVRNHQDPRNMSLHSEVNDHKLSYF